MSVKEQIVTGRSYRRLIDATNMLWQRISFWHKASDCEHDDGLSTENKIASGFAKNNIVFNSDGSISETMFNSSKKTTFNADGSITEVFTDANKNVITQTTTFKPDGSISVS